MLQPKHIAEIRETLRFAAQAFGLYLAFTTIAFAQYVIPSESMVPHLEVGDRVLVSKYAYGYSRHSLPLEAGALLPARTERIFELAPKRGDVAVFVHPVSGKIMIKRVIGLPGDVIAMRDGRLFINGVEAEAEASELVLRRAHSGQVEEALRRTETLPGGTRHATHDVIAGSAFDAFGPYRVPADMLFMMGDNRDNSLDSRSDTMGPVPMENLIGRAEVVHFVMPGCPRETIVACPMRRWMKPLRLSADQVPGTRVSRV